MGTRPFNRGPSITAPAADQVSDGQLLRWFVVWQDARAFEALVRRHGPMVLSVCRRLLGDDHDAEDAFQATFLVLARKAGVIGKPDLLAGWLYRVATRTAAKARVQAARRRFHESRAAVAPVADPLPDASRRDLGSALTAELAGLPERYRAPLVLCYLEGKTNGEAARQLGCPAGSMSSRLARGRELLRQRLTGRWGEGIW